MSARNSIAQLGQLFKAYRESKGLSQQHLADNLSELVNRTIIAHLEQGIRLPSPERLHEIAYHLGIPEKLWISFISDGLRERINRESSSEVVLRLPRIIAVSGIMGSGKTTLAKKIAEFYGYNYITDDTTAKQYLNDLFSRPEIWAFESQVSFFITKAIKIKNALDNGQSIVIDRTLNEDVEIFAQYFHDLGSSGSESELSPQNRDQKQ